MSEVVWSMWDEFALDGVDVPAAQGRGMRHDPEAGDWSVPRDPSKPITAEGVEKFYRNALGLGGKHSPHSWRSAFSTVAREVGKDGDSIESQLDHVVGDKVAAAYDRAKRLEDSHQIRTVPISSMPS